MTDHRPTSPVDLVAVLLAAIGVFVVAASNLPGFLVLAVTFSVVIYAGAVGLLGAVLRAPSAQGSTDLTALVSAAATWAVTLAWMHVTPPFQIVAALALAALLVSAWYMFGVGSLTGGEGSGAERFARRQWLI